MTTTTRTTDDVVSVFEPRGLPPLRPYVAELWRRRDFMAELAKAQIRSSHFDTVLGKVWTVLTPALLAGVYFFLISVVRESESRSTAERFTLLIGCLFLFFYTRNAVSSGSSAIRAQSRLVLNSNFPRAMAPLAAVYESFLQLLLSLLVYFVIHVAVGRPVTAALVVFPVLLAIHTMINVGVALFFAVVTVLVRDVQNLLALMLRVWLYMTPVLYPTNLLKGNVQRVLQWNPLYPVFDSYQKVLLGKWPSAMLILAGFAWGVGMIILGGYVMLSRERELAGRL